MPSRREFLGNAATAAAGLAIASNAKSYAQIAGANERVHFAVIGLNSRAYAHLSSLKANKANARIVGVADVDAAQVGGRLGARGRCGRQNGENEGGQTTGAHGAGGH